MWLQGHLSPRGRGVSSDRPPGQKGQFSVVVTGGAAIPVKVVLVGDSKCGKSALALAYTGGDAPEEPTSTAVPFEVHAKSTGVQGELCAVALWDTAGGEEMDRLRPLCYAHADLVLVCFSVAEPESYESARARWAREVAFHVPGAPVVLAGLMTDLRGNVALKGRLAERGLSPIQFEQGQVRGAGSCLISMLCSLAPPSAPPASPIEFEQHLNARPRFYTTLLRTARACLASAELGEPDRRAALCGVLCLDSHRHRGGRGEGHLGGLA